MSTTDAALLRILKVEGTPDEPLSAEQRSLTMNGTSRKDTASCPLLPSQEAGGLAGFSKIRESSRNNPAMDNPENLENPNQLRKGSEWGNWWIVWSRQSRRT